MSAVPQWLARFGISQPGGTWAAHIARGSAGGVDFPAPVGTNMLAASDGRLTYFKLSDGSSVLRVTRPDGTATDLLHGHPVGPTPRNVKRDEHIGESDGRKGADGAGGSTGPHIHAHDIKGGKRVYPWSTVPDGGGSAGGGITPIKEGNDMSTYALRNDGATALGIDKGAVFIGQGTDPLVWVANPGPEVQLLGVPVAPWDANAIAKRIGEVGVRGSGPDVNKVFASMADARAVPSRPAYTLGAGTVQLGDITVPADPALLEAVKANTVALGELLKATKALNPPG